MQYYPRELLTRYGKNEEALPEWIINEALSYSDKNTLQTYIADYDIMGGFGYQGQWLIRYAELKEELKKKY
jgi:hypothetical protein